MNGDEGESEHTDAVSLVHNLLLGTFDYGNNC